MCPTLTSAATCVKPDLAVVCPITEFLKGGEIRARHVDYLVKKKKKKFHMWQLLYISNKVTVNTTVRINMSKNNVIIVMIVDWLHMTPH